MEKELLSSLLEILKDEIELSKEEIIENLKDEACKISTDFLGNKYKSYPCLERLNKSLIIIEKLNNKLNETIPRDK